MALCDYLNSKFPSGLFSTIYVDIDTTIAANEKTMTFRINWKEVGRGTMQTVKHTLQEFEDLRRELIKHNAPYGIFVPPVPPDPHSEDLKHRANYLIQESVFSLTCFCEMVVGSSFLRFDKSWIKFLQTTGKNKRMVEEELMEAAKTRTAILELVLAIPVDKVATRETTYTEMKKKLNALAVTLDKSLEEIEKVRTCELALELAKGITY
jgi:hypothetical protein